MERNRGGNNQQFFCVCQKWPDGLEIHGIGSGTVGDRWTSYRNAGWRASGRIHRRRRRRSCGRGRRVDINSVEFLSMVGSSGLDASLGRFFLLLVDGSRNHGRRGERQPLHLVYHGDGVHQLLHGCAHTDTKDTHTHTQREGRERERERRTRQLFRRSSLQTLHTLIILYIWYCSWANNSFLSGSFYDHWPALATSLKKRHFLYRPFSSCQSIPLIGSDNCTDYCDSTSFKIHNIYTCTQPSTSPLVVWVDQSVWWTSEKLTNFSYSSFAGRRPHLAKSHSIKMNDTGKEQKR